MVRHCDPPNRPGSASKLFTAGDMTLAVTGGRPATAAARTDGPASDACSDPKDMR